MPRTDKKSRIKGLPTKLQVQVESDTDNRYPYVNRVSSDNRTSNRTAYYDDGKSIIFSSGSISGVYISTGLRTSSPYLNTENTASLIGSGSVRSGIGDLQAINHTYLSGQLKPFRDSDNPAVDGKSVGSTFYATGSSIELIGEGFNQPLWSKSKIEIDISSTRMNPVPVSISQSNETARGSGTIRNVVSGTSYPMCYYNFDLKVWEPIGLGVSIGNGRMGNDARDLFYSGTLGFTAGIGFNFNPVYDAINVRTATQSGTLAQYNVGTGSLLVRASASLQCTNIEYFDKMGNPTDNYCFPFGPQYHATSSQTLKMKNYISRPFLAEKIVIEMSGVNYTVFDTIKSNGFYPEKGVIYPFAKNNIFVLNQRKNRSFSYTPSSPQLYGNGSTIIDRVITVPTNKTLSLNSTGTYVSTNRDILTFGTIISVPTDFSSTYKRFLLPSPSLGYTYASNVTASMYWTLVTKESINSLVDKNTNLITQSYIIEDFLKKENDFVIRTSKSLSTNRMTALGFQGAEIKLEMNVCTPNVYPNNGYIDPVFSTDAYGFFNTYDVELGGRNMLGLTNISGRDMLNSYGIATPNINAYGINGLLNISANSKYGLSSNNEYPYVKSNFVTFAAGLYSISPLYVDNNLENLRLKYNKVNPYILMPEDELIIGWQQPIPNILEMNSYLSMSISGTYAAGAPNYFQFGSYQVTGVIPGTTTAATAGEGIVHISSLQINGPGKIIIYGSEIANGEEYHDTLNQVLTSNTIHEVIG